MSAERVYLFDTTLRDGAQTTGVDFSLADKIQIAGLLDGLGVDYVEGGYPGANPLDTEFFSTKRTKHARFARKMRRAHESCGKRMMNAWSLRGAHGICANGTERFGQGH